MMFAERSAFCSQEWKNIWLLSRERNKVRLAVPVEATSWIEELCLELEDVGGIQFIPVGLKIPTNAQKCAHGSQSSY